MNWQTVYESFLNNPRDVKTTPKTNRTPLWFFVYAEDDNLYIENAKNHINSSKITQRRKLDKNNFLKMTDLNDRRDRGFSVSKEATSVTVNQVYWFGIFHDLQQ